MAKRERRPLVPANPHRQQTQAADGWCGTLEGRGGNPSESGWCGTLEGRGGAPQDPGWCGSVTPPADSWGTSTSAARETVDLGVLARVLAGRLPGRRQRL
jgi:hypothetical protein